MKNRYNKGQFKADRQRLLDLVGNKISYAGNDPGTFRVSFGDDVLGLRFDIYLSTRTLVIFNINQSKPKSFHNLTWTEIENAFNNIYKFLT